MKAIKNGAMRGCVKVAGLGAIGAVAVGLGTLLAYVTRKPEPEEDFDGYIDVPFDEDEE